MSHALSVEPHRARVGSQVARHHVEHGRLSRSVRPDQPRDRPGGDRERASVDRDDAAEPLLQIRDLEKRNHRIGVEHDAHEPTPCVAAVSNSPGVRLLPDPPRRMAATRSTSDGMIPLGSTSITTRKTVAYPTRYSWLDPKRYARYCCAGTRSEAPSAGPQSVALPPR